jgi:hypothetical protein
MSLTKQPVVFPGVSNHIPLEECDVEDGGVVVYKLQEIDLEGERIVVLGLRPVQLKVGHPRGHVAVDLKEM